MNDQSTFTAQLLQIIVIIVAFTIAGLKKRRRLANFWAGMARGWRASIILALIYLIALCISLSTFDANLPYMLISGAINGVFMFCLIMMGIGFGTKIDDFKPFLSSSGVRAVPTILTGTVVLIALAGMINIPVGRGLIALGITGPPEPTSGLGFFQEFPLFQVLATLLVGAGIAEEVFYRLFVMSALWALFKRPFLAILISAMVFAIYHLTPLNSLYLTFWKYPIYQFITTFLFGLGAGWIYQRYRLEAVILGHTLGNFLGVIIIKLSL